MKVSNVTEYNTTKTSLFYLAAGLQFNETDKLTIIKRALF